LQWNFFDSSFRAWFECRAIRDSLQKPTPELRASKNDERTLGHSPLIGVISIDGETYDP
jgi:hypothetical protein